MVKGVHKLELSVHCMNNRVPNKVNFGRYEVLEVCF